MGGAERDSLLKKNRGATGSGLYFRPTTENNSIILNSPPKDYVHVY